MLYASKVIPQHIPQIVSYSLNSSALFLKYKFIPVDTLHYSFVFNKGKTDWNYVIEKYQELIHNMSNIHPTKFNYNNVRKQLIQMYIQKTIDRLTEISIQSKFAPFFINDHVIINQKKYPSLKRILLWFENQSKLINKKHSSNLIKSICTPRLENYTFFHGDLCFSNVFIDENADKIYCIDPRGSFGNSKIYGDKLFEYAKIYESVDGLYDFVIEDKFLLKFNGNVFHYKLLSNFNTTKIGIIFTRLFPKQFAEEIALIESLQFLCMIPWHSDHYRRQLIFICLGITRFWNIIKKEWK